jgi:hypothetical protein
MSNPIKNALEALALAKQCGGELDLKYYNETHAALDKAVQAARAYDQSIGDADRPPTGADYEHIMSLLGLRTVDAVDYREAAVAAAIEKTKQPAETVLRLAVILGLDETVQTDTVRIEVDVVDFTQRRIGGEDSTAVAATLDLHTGRVALVDYSLGHPMPVLGDACDIRERPRHDDHWQAR